MAEATEEGSWRGGGRTKLGLLLPSIDKPGGL